MGTLLAQAAQDAPDNTAVWLTFVGAIVVALIAAATAQWRSASNSHTTENSPIFGNSASY